MPAPEIGDAVDVNVDANAFGAVPGGGHAEISHLGTNAGEGGQALDCVENIAVPFVVEDDGRLL